MVDGMHLTPIGGGAVLLEPGEALDPGAPDRYAVPYLQERGARRLIYDLSNVPVVDELYYAWLLQVHRLCRVAGIELVAANMHADVAFALSLQLHEPPPFACALDVDRARHATLAKPA
jgi:hypothetical protein